MCGTDSLSVDEKSLNRQLVIGSFWMKALRGKWAECLSSPQTIAVASVSTKTVSVSTAIAKTISSIQISGISFGLGISGSLAQVVSGIAVASQTMTISIASVSESETIPSISTAIITSISETITSISAIQISGFGFGFSSGFGISGSLAKVA